MKVRADKAYNSAEHLAWLRGRGIVPRIARAGIESSERLGRHCFLVLAATIPCCKKLAKLPT
ncbi:hypothetical protein [Actinomadura chokoriensis]|uniref:hypothetical protein n=1 Tax=Actinomadura chokoriensis TaxID=454156 RepID=UPI0031F7A61E